MNNGKKNKKPLAVRIMAIFLSLLMLGGCMFYIFLLIGGAM